MTIENILSPVVELRLDFCANKKIWFNILSWFLVFHQGPRNPAAKTTHQLTANVVYSAAPTDMTGRNYRGSKNSPNVFSGWQKILFESIWLWGIKVGVERVAGSIICPIPKISERKCHSIPIIYFYWPLNQLPPWCLELSLFFVNWNSMTIKVLLSRIWNVKIFTFDKRKY